jgi:hypothetical protein
MALAGFAGVALQQEPASEQEAAPALDLSALEAGPEDFEARLALALWEAHQRRLGAALGRLDALPSAGGAEGLERARRERERIAALQAARDGRLAAAAAEGARIPLQRGSERALAKVLGFADGQVKLGNNRFSLDAIAADELSCAELLKQEESLPAGSPKWVRAYALLLAREGDWERALPASSGDAAEDELQRSLRADAEGFGAMLRLGRAAGELAELARFPVQAPSSVGAAEAQAALAAIRGVLGELSDLPFVAARRDRLRVVATAALGASFDTDPGVPGLRGKAQRLENGLVRISYAFDDPEEAQDFALLADALPDWHDSMQPVEKPIAESYLIARQGAFYGDGQVTYRHALDFAAPVRVRYAMRYVAREGDPVDVGVVLIGLAWDGSSSFVAASDFGDVYATEYDLGRGERSICEGERSVKVGEVYEVEARLESGPEGATIQAWRGGTPRQQLSAGALRSGGLFLFVHTPRIVAFESIEIEGRAETFSMRALRERWVSAQLAELGL